MSNVKQILKKVISQFDTDLTKSDIRKINDFRKSLKEDIEWSVEFKELYNSLLLTCDNKELVDELLLKGEFIKIAIKNSCSIKLKNISPENYKDLYNYLKSNLNIKEKVA